MMKPAADRIRALSRHVTRRKSMKTVLCYGDSNTWGYNPSTEDRYPLAERWVSVLALALGPEYLVIPEGLNGRTTVWPDPSKGSTRAARAT
jgi:lysophospholipase L1-like esterase